MGSDPNFASISLSPHPMRGVEGAAVEVPFIRYLLVFDE